MESRQGSVNVPSRPSSPITEHRVQFCEAFSLPQYHTDKEDKQIQCAHHSCEATGLVISTVGLLGPAKIRHGLTRQSTARAASVCRRIPRVRTALIYTMQRTSTTPGTGVWLGQSRNDTLVQECPHPGCARSRSPSTMRSPQYPHLCFWPHRQWSCTQLSNGHLQPDPEPRHHPLARGP